MKWWDPKSEGLPRPCTCLNGPCEGGEAGGCGYDPAEWEAWEAKGAARLLALAHAITNADTEEGKAIRAHLITMGWRPPT